jgi:hypothetical protein
MLVQVTRVQWLGQAQDGAAMAGLITGLWLRGVAERTSPAAIPPPFPQPNSTAN